MAHPREKLARFLKNVNVEYDLTDVHKIIGQSKRCDRFGPDNVRTNVVEHFLYCGKFNSVLGPSGFNHFKDELKDVVKKVNAGEFGANYINLDRMFEVLLASGIYYREECIPEDLRFLKTDDKWLTAYRYIAKNFPRINYKEFREIVARFKEAHGISIYVEPGDSEFLRSLTENQLFTKSVDLKAALVHLSMKELRDICEKLGVHAARGIEETAARLFEEAGDKVNAYLPNEAVSRATLVIRDQDLATGNQIVSLDQYLRAIAKTIRDDLVQFIDKSRFGTLAA